MEIRPRQVNYVHHKTSELSLFVEWLEHQDSVAEEDVIIRLERIMITGHLGDYKLLPGTGGVYELRFRRHGHLRVYFGCRKDQIFILLGGNKKIQVKDIKKATLL